MYPDAPLIKRQGEVDAWDNEDFRKAIKATGKTQVIIAGIVTDACKCSF
jgi:isochorismate hydrolase